MSNLNLLIPRILKTGGRMLTTGLQSRLPTSRTDAEMSSKRAFQRRGVECSVRLVANIPVSGNLKKKKTLLNCKVALIIFLFMQQ